MAERALVVFFGGKKGSGGIFLALWGRFDAKKGLGAFFWLFGGVLMVKRVCGGIFLALRGRFDGKKDLGAIFYESSYAVTWGSLRMRSRPPPPM